MIYEFGIGWHGHKENHVVYYLHREHIAVCQHKRCKQMARFTKPSTLLKHLADHQERGDKVDPAITDELLNWLSAHNVDAFIVEH